MDIRQQVVDDLKRRVTILPEEIAGWRQMTEQNKNGMGIHRSQVKAIDAELKALDAKQQEALERLDPTQSPKDVAAARYEVERQLGALHGIASIFRNVFLQRQGEPITCPAEAPNGAPEPGGDGAIYRDELRCALRAADLVAADCYNSCINLAEGWGVVKEGRFRPPPLTFLNALSGPAAYTRRSSFSVFKVPLELYSELKLPISLVSMPFHYTEGLWTYCSLYHEVGHPLDQDLELNKLLTKPLNDRLAAEGVAAGQIGKWEFWLREIVADAFGVLFGGEAYAWSLIDLLFLPESEVTMVNAQDTHPNPYVRVFLLGALLRRADAERFTPIADEIEAYWREVYGKPADLEEYLKPCEVVAEVLLDEPLPRLDDHPGLDNHRLLDLVPSFVADRGLIDKLADYLELNLIRPSPNELSIRLVPAAAQLAARRDEPDLAGIHARGIDFLYAIKQPTFLGVTGAESEEDYLRGLVAEIDFSTFLDDAP